MFKATQLLFCIFCSTFLIGQSAEKWNFGFNLNATAGKMLWEDQSSTFFPIDYPNTPFRFSYGLGLTSHYDLNEHWYIPIQLDYINRKFAIATDGVVMAVDENGQWIAIMADHIDYQLNQLSITSGIGYRFTNLLSVELSPYFQKSIGVQQLKVSNIIDWRKAEDFQQEYDYGMSAHLRLDIKVIYVKLAYFYGLRSIVEYGAVDAVGSSIGKFPIKNTLALLSIGYAF